MHKLQNAGQKTFAVYKMSKVLLYASAQAYNNAYNVHTGIWTSPPAA